MSREKRMYCFVSCLRSKNETTLICLLTTKSSLLSTATTTPLFKYYKNTPVMFLRRFAQSFVEQARTYR